MPVRRCEFCGASLEGHRRDARFCSSAHRTEAWRLARLLSGRPVGRYRTVADRMAAFGRPRRQSRSQKPPGALDSIPTSQVAGRCANSPRRGTEGDSFDAAQR